MPKINYKSKMQPIPLDRFLNLTGFSPDQLGFDGWKKISQIVAPVDLKEIITVSAMPISYLHGLLAKIGTLGDPGLKVFAGAGISLGCIDPNLLHLGQKFVYRKNYTSIMENFRHLFIDFAVPRGIAKMSASLIVGRDNEDRLVLAHYLPPIIEVHDNKMVILDGVHRSFIAKNSGMNLESIVIEGVKTPFPCAPKPWNEIRVVDEKPPNIEDRYFDLRVELFRDLKGIGIDG